MTIDNECVGCIINQSVKVADAIGADETLKNRLRTTVESMSKDFSFSKTPPEIAADVYEKMSEIAKKEDLYDEVKKLSTQKARAFIPFLKKKLHTCKDKLLTATKIAVAGNVIDLAAQVEFDLEEELDKVFHTKFSHDDFEAFEKVLQTAKNVVILGDNVGEHIFDYLFIETLQNLYPELTCTYMVRGNPIINDVTCKEAEEAGFDKLCNLVDSGVNTPGFVYERATQKARKLFDEADIVISKGMGNYECLNPSHRANICFLLKVKCNVVANSLGKEVGDIICKLTERNKNVT
ncbi:ARMT1-like domain-containing protein [Sulfurimonas sp. SWIR-19]|uniref:damage-control phosphatase ARMT1 family protein n=1 Tax=Sulfurimonas sp. SWIR-19 TaxID=2878390 RepID=UPI001CF3AA67|nr:ARMT1-like domain-containing protein [Sulfurimonas sp. SWIR-19]UCM99892.1 ARMT1-like domain-containing protein [Sulfurimonas sp. SWIR-19]